MKTVKTVVFLSNFFNHHQKPFADAMYEKLGEGFTFIETIPMSQERINMGWALESVPSYVVGVNELNSRKKEYEALINEADVVIFGNAPYELVKYRIRANKLTLRYSERIFKRGLEPWKYLLRLIRLHWMYPQNKNVHLLCASAYAAEDYSKFFLFKKRSYKWGYFPTTKRYTDIDRLIEDKNKNSIIWVARYLPLKHPEIAVEIARRLKSAGYQFELNMIGNGQLLEKTRATVKQQGLEDVVHIVGAVSPEEVRRYMERSEIHIFTSDQNEGWGAVLNEAMNSACVPVANRNIGSAPYLLQDGVNGCCYSQVEELYDRVKSLLDSPKERKDMAKAAYKTIMEEWNAEIAAERLLLLSETILRKETNTIQKGCCSYAK